MSNITFPKDYDETGPNHISVSNPTKKLIKLINFIDRAVSGKFLGMFKLDENEIQRKYPVIYQKLKSGGRLPVGDITEALKMYQDFFVEGNWPADKLKLTKDILVWVYHPKTHNSRFIECLEKMATRNLSHITRATELDRRAVNKIIEYSEWFEEPQSAVVAVFNGWWNWMKLKIREVELKKGYGGRDLTAEMGSGAGNAWHWIDDYIQWVIPRITTDTIPARVLSAKSKWAINFIRDYARGHEDQTWDLLYEEYDKEY